MWQSLKSDNQAIVEKEVKVVSEDIRSVNGRATSRHWRIDESLKR